MDPYSGELLWIVIVGFIIGFFLAFGVGANDVANSFGTSVGSKVLTLRQACILATIFEILGAVLLGYKVSDTVRKGIFDVEMYSEFERELMLGYLAALTGSAIWNLVATFFRWPISGTHSIVGAVVGASLVSRGLFSIKWVMLGQIVASWFLSPVMSGMLSSGIFLFIKKLILVQENSTDRGFLALPFFYGFTIFINLFSVIHDGPHYLRFDKVPWWGVFILSTGIGVMVGLCVWYILVPHLKNQLFSSPDLEGSTNHIEQIDARPKIPYPEAANPSFEENGNHIPLENIAGNDSISRTDSTQVFSVENNSKNFDIALDVKDIGASDSPETAKIFSSLQVLTAVFASFAHGANDVSNAIGPVIAVWLIFVEGNVMQVGESPFWIMLYGGFGICIGLWVWGQRVIQTIGEDLTKITPSSGFTIEIGAATTVLLASKIGLPISTTHCKVGSVVFVGWTRSRAAVDWKLFRSIVLAWVLTLPVSGGLSALCMAILRAAFKC